MAYLKDMNVIRSNTSSLNIFSPFACSLRQQIFVYCVHVRQALLII